MNVTFEGNRNNALFEVGLELAEKGKTFVHIATTLLNENSEKCLPPLPDTEVYCIAKSVVAREAYMDFIRTSTEWRQP